MTELYQWFSLYLPYIAPPLIGAFIGYLTNKIAIRMLFRPLKPWYFGKIRIPMTPGVIPSKRHLLAVNIGKMVGGHLLTGKEIGRALKRPSFRSHLAGLIESRVGAIFAKELAPLSKLIPRQYFHYFDIGVKTIAYQIRQQIHGFIRSQKFESRLETIVHEATAGLLHRDINSYLDRDGRETVYQAMDRRIKKLVAGENLEKWFEDLLYAQANRALENDYSLRRILPDSLVELLLTAVEEKTPELLEKLAEISEDPEVQDRIVDAVKKAIEQFTSSLGPMASMVQRFLSGETIEKNVKNYLQNNKEEIRAWLGSAEVRERVVRLLLERIHHYLDEPVSAFIPEQSSEKLRRMCKSVSVQITALLRQENVSSTISAFIAENIEIALEDGNRELEAVLIDAAGDYGPENCRRMVSEAAVSLVRSEQAKRFIDAVVNQMIASLLRRPVGRLDHFVPAPVRKGMYEQLQTMSLAMLATEVPGLVASLNLEQIVAEKLDSLDLLQLERLLLSIMEEQFKYINLFGALLGLVIGTLNVVLLYLF